MDPISATEIFLIGMKRTLPKPHRCYLAFLMKRIAETDGNILEFGKEVAAETGAADTWSLRWHMEKLMQDMEKTCIIETPSGNERLFLWHHETDDLFTVAVNPHAADMIKKFMKQ